MMKPKVSVRIITYNHAPYIRQAVESVLAQRTNFEYEILIGEDGSSDGTRDIVRELAARYPGKIKPFYRSRADVIHINGHPTGRANFIATLQAAHGEYVAFLDGDDYWTSVDKLQKQSDYLDAHSEDVLCFHGVEVVYSDGRNSHILPLKRRAARFEQRDLLAGTVPPMCSVMARNGIVRDLPEWHRQVEFADLPLFALLTEHGSLGFIDETLAAYRIHPGGIWTSGTTHGAWTPEVRCKRYKAFITFCEVINAHLGHRYDTLLREKITNMSYDLVWIYQQKRDWRRMREYLFKGLKNGPQHPEISNGFILRSLLVALFPWLYVSLRALKKSTISKS